MGKCCVLCKKEKSLDNFEQIKLQSTEKYQRLTLCIECVKEVRDMYPLRQKKVKGVRYGHSKAEVVEYIRNLRGWICELSVWLGLTQSEIGHILHTNHGLVHSSLSLYYDNRSPIQISIGVEPKIEYEVTWDKLIRE